MSDNEFRSEKELEEWLLRERVVNKTLLGNYANVLYKGTGGIGYITKTSLLGVKVGELTTLGIPGPTARELENKLALNGAADEPEDVTKKNSFVDYLDEEKYEEAEVELFRAATSWCPHNPKSHRHPPATQLTWNIAMIGQELKNIRNKQLPGLIAAADSPTSRQAVAIGLRLGSGFGKTHILTEAPDILGVSTSIYITYNHEQQLELDKKVETTKKAACLRLILASNGCNSLACANFFEDSASSRFFLASPVGLENLVIARFRRLAKDADIVLAADEVAQLGYEPARQVVSLLSNLCTRYSKATNSICTVLISSLNDAVFTTSSGRGIIDLVPGCANSETIKFFQDQLGGKEVQAHFGALAKAICGTHMRSIVICFNEMRTGSTPSVDTMFNLMKPIMGIKLDSDHYNAIIARIKDCMISTASNPSYGKKIEELIDNDGVLCPAFIKLAFSHKGEANSVNHLNNLFQTLREIHADGKDLEVAAMRFDLFRASLGVPVVPGSAKILLPTMKSGFTQAWFRKLVFADDMTVSNEDLLIVRDIKESGESVEESSESVEESIKAGEQQSVKAGGQQSSKGKRITRKKEVVAGSVEERSKRAKRSKRKKDGIARSVEESSKPAKRSKRKKEVVVSETRPTLGTYYYPATAGHPYIDRAYVSVHSGTGEHCLVLTQEKVNDDFSIACEKLNTAASMLTKKWKFTKVLLVVNVIGTSQNTWAREKLEWPCILIREKEEVKDFYSVNFADLIFYARESHLLKHDKALKMDQK